jgi:hypothetical protein
MYDLIYLADMGAWVLLALGAWKFLPKVRIPFWSAEQNERAPWTGLFWLFLIGSTFFYAIMIGALSITLSYYLASQGWRFRASHFFDLGIIANVAQIVGAGSACAILIRCWPVAVAAGAGSLLLLDHWKL